MAYRTDVEFLENANPPLIEASANEYARLHTLLSSCEDDFRKACTMQWESESRGRYDTRLREARDLAEYLAHAFKRVRDALDGYADAVATATSHFKSGQTTEDRLADVISREATPITPTARAAEPMRQWEDLRGTTGFLDWVAELGVDVDEIEEEAERYYNSTRDHYDDAKSVESRARETCVSEIRAALRSLPEFRGGDFAQVGDLYGRIEDLRTELTQASDNPGAQLPGTGVKVDEFPTVGPDTAVSPALQRIRDRLGGTEAEGNYLWLPSNDDENRRNYISSNSQLLRDAADLSGLPPEMLAGIAWQEVEGQPSWTDEVVPWVRRSLPFTEEEDRTSLGPMSIQTRRAAEVLGYDPDNLTDAQRTEITDAVKDPAQNIYIAAEYLAQLKAESGFGNVPPEEMTEEQMQELAARYNGGPYYQSDDAQAYGRAFHGRREQVKEALGE